MANEGPPQMQLNQQQQEEAYPTRAPHGSVGAVIAVLAVITVLGVIAGMIGRLCSGRRVMGLGEYDLESWVEAKCSSCVDGRMPAPPAPRQPAEDAGTPEEEATQEVKEDEEQEEEEEERAGNERVGRQ